MQAVIVRTANAGMWLKSLLVFLASAIPFTESKGAIVLAAAMKVKWYVSWLVSWAGSSLVVPVIVFFKKQQAAFLDRLTNNLKQKHPKLDAYLEKYGWVGLVALISIPFTGIGCWFGALAVRFLHLDRKKACIAILLGDLIGCFVTAMCVYGIFTGIKLLL